MLPDQLREKYEKAKRAKKSSQGKSSGDMDQERLRRQLQRQNATQRKEREARANKTAWKKSELSRIEKRYREDYNSTLSADLTQFGYDIFEDVSVQASELAVPHDDYVLGPGDQLRIRVWGSSVDTQFTGEIAPDGTIDVPKIGVISIAGAELGEAESIIRNEATKYVQGINIDVSLQKLRSLEVYIVGAVENPGLHLVPAFSTVLKGLVAAGGVKKIGSLRHVQLFRDDTLQQSVDLYNLLLQGSRESDVLLENRDVIYVPRLENTAGVAGAVQQEGIFELEKDRTIGQLLELAGGVLPQAFTGRIYLRRFQDNNEFVVQDIDTSKRDNWRQIKVSDGDLLEFQYLSQAKPQASTVKLRGHVWYPDVYEYQSGLMLSDVLTSKSLIKPEAVMDFGLIKRYDRETTRYRFRKFPLDDVFAGDFDLELKPRDTIRILSREKLGIEQTVRIEGAVWQNGTYPYRPGMTVEDLVAQAGGVKFSAAKDRAALSRHHIEQKEVVTTHETLSLRKDAEVSLQPYDYLFVPRLNGAGETNTVKLSGEVRYPGTYRIKEDERLSDVLERAGGFTDQAYFYGAKFTSEDARKIQQESIDRMIRDLQMRIQQVSTEQAQTAVGQEDVEAAQLGMQAAQNVMSELKAVEAEGRVSINLSPLKEFRSSDDDFRLNNGDELFVPKKPNFVSVVGSVYSPSAYGYHSDQTVEDYLAKSGGPTEEANQGRIYVLKANGEVVSKARNDSLFFDTFDNMRLRPGDTIVVPRKIERIPVLRMVRDVSDILFKIATTAGVALSL